MSVAATTWAWSRPSDEGGVRGNDRLVLLAVADAADSKGQNAWPAVETIAAMAGLSERTVQRSIRSLEKLGILRVDQQEGGDSKVRSDRRPNKYTLAMDPDHGVTERHPVPAGDAVDNSGDGATAVSPRSDDGVTDETSRGDKTGLHGVTQLCHPNKDLNKSKQLLAPTAVDAVENVSLRNAILEACQLDPSKITSSALGAIDKAVRDLEAVEALPDEVPAATAVFRSRFPNATLTPLALAKHWPLLGGPKSLPTKVLSEPEKFGMVLGRSSTGPLGAVEQIHDRFDEPERAVACQAFKDTRQLQLEGSR